MIIIVIIITMNDVDIYIYYVITGSIYNPQTKSNESSRKHQASQASQPGWAWYAPWPRPWTPTAPAPPGRQCCELRRRKVKHDLRSQPPKKIEGVHLKFQGEFILMVKDVGNENHQKLVKKHKLQWWKPVDFTWKDWDSSKNSGWSARA